MAGRQNASRARPVRHRDPRRGVAVHDRQVVPSSGNGAQPDGGRVEKDRVAMEEVPAGKHAHSRCAQFLEQRGIRSPPALGIVSHDDQHVVTKTRYLVHGKVDDRPAGAEAQVRDQMDDAHGQLRLVITRRERG